MILNEAPKCSHFLFNFFFIIYSISEKNYFQGKKESLKNRPTLPFVFYCLIPYNPLGISYYISVIFLKCKTFKTKRLYLPYTPFICLLLKC